MNLLKLENGDFTFHLSKREKLLLLAVLDRYPLIPSRHQPLSKSAASAESETDQRLLDEALAEHRQENKRRLQTWLENEQRFTKTDSGWHLLLNRSEIEWLLQVLNDIRVGSWIILGSPEKDLWDFTLNEKTAPLGWTMEMAGWFEAALLEALQPGGAT